MLRNHERQLSEADLAERLRTGEVGDSLEINGQTVEELLYLPITVDKFSFERDIIAPTPLDPYGLKVRESDYETSVHTYLRLTLDHRLDELGIQLEGYFDDAITEEISVAHIYQMSKNDESFHRLRQHYEKGQISVTREQAEAIYRERAGYGTSINRLRLLSDFPEMESIEDMKLTAPLDEGKIVAGRQLYFKRLERLANESDDFTFDFIPEEEQIIRRVDASRTAKPNTIVTKRTPVIAMNKKNGMIFELHQKDGYTLLPLDVDLGEAPCKQVDINGQTFNLQHIGISAYWVCRPNEDSFEMPEV